MSKVPNPGLVGTLWCGYLMERCGYIQRQNTHPRHSQERQILIPCPGSPPS
jgi:hypothetical protein